jgi:hypothetical protein
VDAVAAARRALDPTGVILHMRLRMDAPTGVNGGIQRSFQETWTAQDPSRWRLEQWSLDRGGKLLHRSELAYGHGELSIYDGPKLVIRQGYRDDTLQTRLPSLFSQTGGDPDTDLRALLSSGRLRDEGEQQVEGRTVRRLVRDDPEMQFVVDVDPVTFVPVAGSLAFGSAPEARRSPVFTFAVEVFERLPVTSANEQRLKITPPAGTRRVVSTAADMRRYEREYRKWRKQCRRQESGDEICPAPRPYPGAG